jgi:hypothetical protein
MSDNERTDARPVQELDLLVRHLADELAAFRRRALVAEARLKEVEGHEHGAVNLDLAARVSQLEKENKRLQDKLESAGTRAKQMLDRVRFLRQQAQAGVGGGGDR